MSEDISFEKRPRQRPLGLPRQDLRSRPGPDDQGAPPVAVARPPERAVTDRVLILGDDIGIFLAVARSLGRRGIEVHVAPTDLEAPGLASDYIATVHILPAYHASPAAWLDSLRNLIAEYNYRLVLPCSDCSLALLHQHAEVLGRDILAVPNGRAAATFTDKVETRALARACGVPVAQGGQLSPETGATELADRLGLPLVLKPRTSYAIGSKETKRSALIVRDFDTLEGVLAAPPQEGWLAETFFDGEGVGVSVLGDRGRILLAWQHRRLQTFSEAGGSTVRTGEPLDQRLLADVERLAVAAELSGVGMFEFRRNPQTGEYILLEVNPRFWGSLPLAVAAGADFPSLLWDLKTGSGVRNRPNPRVETTKRNLTGELDRLAGEFGDGGSAFGKLRALGAAVGLCASLFFRARFDTWAADDPAPFLAERRLLARRLLRAFAKRIPVGFSGAEDAGLQFKGSSGPNG